MSTSASARGKGKARQRDEDKEDEVMVGKKGSGWGKGKAAVEEDDEEDDAVLMESGDEKDDEGEDDDDKGSNEQILSVGGAVVPMMHHHWEDLRLQAASESALLGWGFMNLKEEKNPAVGGFKFQEWNPRLLDPAMVTKLLQSFTDMGVESWKWPIDVVVDRELVKNVEELAANGLDLKKVPIVQFTAKARDEIISIAAGQHRFAALQRYAEEKVKAAAKMSKKGRTTRKKKKQGDAWDGELEKERQAVLQRQEEANGAYLYIVRLWDAKIARANNGQIARFISQNRNRPEKEEGEGERFMMGLEKLRDAMQRMKAELKVKTLTAEQRAEATSLAVSGSSRKWSVTQLLSTPYVVDLVFKMQTMGSHFQTWENFNSFTLQGMFLRVHGKMLSSIAMHQLVIWEMILLPTEFLPMDRVKAVLQEMRTAEEGLAAEEEDEAAEVTAARSQQVKRARSAGDRLMAMMEGRDDDEPLLEIIRQSGGMLNAANMIYLDTLGTVEMLPHFGLPYGVNKAYDDAYTEYVEKMVEWVEENVTKGKFDIPGKEAEVKMVKKSAMVKMYWLLEGQRKAGWPQMPLLTSGSLDGMHRTMVEVDTAIAEVIRWFEPGFEISRANSSKDGWRDHSMALFDWFKKQGDHFWAHGAEDAFYTFTMSLMGRRMPDLYQLMWALYMSGCKYVERPLRKHEYELLWEEANPPGLRQKAAWRGRVSRLTKELGHAPTNGDILRAYQAELKKYVQHLAGKSGMGANLTRDVIREFPPLGIYQVTSWAWYGQGNPARPGQTHGVITAVEFSIIFHSRPYALTLPSIKALRADLHNILRGQTKANSLPAYFDLVFLSHEVKRLQGEKALEVPSWFDDPVKLKEAVRLQRQGDADAEGIVGLIQRVMKSPYALAVRDSGLVERKVPATNDFLRPWSGEGRTRALELRGQVSKKVYDALKSLHRALSENASQQRLRRIENNVDWTFVVEEDTVYPPMPAAGKLWVDKCVVQRTSDLPERTAKLVARGVRTRSPEPEDSEGPEVTKEVAHGAGTQATAGPSTEEVGPAAPRPVDHNADTTPASVPGKAAQKAVVAPIASTASPTSGSTGPAPYQKAAAAACSAAAARQKAKDAAAAEAAKKAAARAKGPADEEDDIEMDEPVVLVPDSDGPRQTLPDDPIQSQPPLTPLEEIEDDDGDVLEVGLKGKSDILPEPEPQSGSEGADDQTHDKAADATHVAGAMTPPTSSLDVQPPQTQQAGEAMEVDPPLDSQQGAMEDSQIPRTPSPERRPAKKRSTNDMSPESGNLGQAGSRLRPRKGQVEPELEDDDEDGVMSGDEIQGEESVQRGGARGRKPSRGGSGRGGGGRGRAAKKK